MLGQTGEELLDIYIPQIGGINLPSIPQDWRLFCRIDVYSSKGLGGRGMPGDAQSVAQHLPAHSPAQPPSESCKCAGRNIPTVAYQPMKWPGRIFGNHFLGQERPNQPTQPRGWSSWQWKWREAAEVLASPSSTEASTTLPRLVGCRGVCDFLFSLTFHIPGAHWGFCISSCARGKLSEGW